MFDFSCKRCMVFTVHGPQLLLFSNFFIKNGFHGTIYIFKNYFVTVFFSFQFLVFSFQLYPNEPRTRIMAEPTQHFFLKYVIVKKMIIIYGIHPINNINKVDASPEMIPS